MNLQFNEYLIKLKNIIIYSFYEHKIVLMSILSIFIGIISGFGAIIFRYMILLNQLLFNLIPTFLGSNFIFLMPMLGGLIVGLLTNYLAPECSGHSIPEIIEAMALRGGRIKKRVALVKLIASSITIGSGGSAGRVGPIAQIGASCGSTIGQLAKLDENNIKLLVGCGVSAGIAATFNAPFGGLLFGIEVILSSTRLDIKIILNMMISIVIATLISNIFLGTTPAFPIESLYTFTNPIEIFYYSIFGVIMGFFGIFWVKFLYFIEGIFKKLTIPGYFKPMIGGLVVGLIALLFSPQIMGVGYETIDLTLKNSIPMLMLLGLCLFKLLATSFSIGSGGSGGVFAPSLFMGATLGGFIGILFNLLNTNFVPSPNTFAIVGMGALFAGAARAPLTCIIMTIEMTLNYQLIIPLMLSCTISYVINFLILKHKNIYTLKLIRRGINVKYNYYIDIYDDIKVSDVMKTNVVTINENTKINDILTIMEKEHHMGYPVLNDKNELIGIITFDDIRKAILNKEFNKTASDLCKRKLITITEDDTLHQAMSKMLKYKIGRLIVIDKNNPNKLIGIITKGDIFKAHELESMKLKIEK